MKNGYSCLSGPCNFASSLPVEKSRENKEQSMHSWKMLNSMTRSCGSSGLKQVSLLFTTGNMRRSLNWHNAISHPSNESLISLSFWMKSREDIILVLMRRSGSRDVSLEKILRAAFSWCSGYGICWFKE